MIAIHNSSAGFHPYWLAYCKNNNIAYKLVDCYANTIIKDLKNCQALMWHHHQGNPKDIIIAKNILFALEHTGFVVFPNFKTGWHFDDKLAQKYLLESINAPFVSTFVFFDKKKAMDWCVRTSFPKVFKLRHGAGSSNVKLVTNRSQAKHLISKAFSTGFSSYDTTESLKERFRKWKAGMTTFFDVLKGVARVFYPPLYSRVYGRELGYVLFQEFLPNNKSDTRIIVIGNKAFALKRYVRENDFRASGSGNFAYAKDIFDERCVRIAFDINKKIGSQCIAYDFVYDNLNQPQIIEISYGFSKAVYDPCPGFWTDNLKWVEGEFNPQGWMIEEVLRQSNTIEDK